MKKFNIGDIVFVSNYEYKNGATGTNHSFVIIDDGQAVDMNYFGFLLSSKTEKSTYPYNESLNKNQTNGLKKDSIVKCDDLIEIAKREIVFKIGYVEQVELERFMNTYMKYLQEIWEKTSNSLFFEP